MSDLANKNEIKEKLTLTPKEDTFAVLYTAIGEETFCHGTLSAERAGYSKASARTAAWKLLRMPKIKERIAEIHTENMSQSRINTASQLAKLEHLRRKAEEKGDLSTAVRCVELTGKYLQMFSDKHIIITEEPQHEMSPEKENDLRNIADEYYSRKYLAQPVSQTNENFSQETPITPPTGPH